MLKLNSCSLFNLKTSAAVSTLEVQHAFVKNDLTMNSGISWLALADIPFQRILLDARSAVGTRFLGTHSYKIDAMCNSVEFAIVHVNYTTK